MDSNSAVSFNYLIISDLHLQEAEKNPAGRLFYFDQEFTEFLQYYRLFHEGQRRWKLIIAGDLIEFYHKINEQPSLDDKLLKGIELTDTDLKFYPGTEWPKSAWKLDRILSSHQLLLIALARFVVEGNEVHILRGNHDLELFWPQVQDRFRQLVSKHYPAGYTYQDTKAAVAARIHFLPWFYFEQDLLYVEHGHQYDPFCSNAHNLYPVLPENRQQLELALSAFSMRYFVAQILHVDPAAMENINSIPKYLLQLIRGNLRQVLQLPLYYLEMVARTNRKVRQVQSHLELPIQEEEAKVREEIKAAYGLTDKALHTIERLTHRPVLLNRWETIKCFSLDLLLAGIVALVVGVGLSLTVPTLPWRWASLSISVFVIGVLVLLGKVRVSKFNNHRNLRGIARTIRDATGSRYVVFGHSHDPDAYPLSPSKDQWYFNVGTWVPRRSNGQFVYLQILREEANAAVHLLRWDRRQQQPVELDLASYTKGTAQRKAMLKKEVRNARRS